MFCIYSGLMRPVLFLKCRTPLIRMWLTCTGVRRIQNGCILSRRKRAVCWRCSRGARGHFTDDDTHFILTKLWLSLIGTTTKVDTPLPESSVQLRMKATELTVQAQLRYYGGAYLLSGVNPSPLIVNTANAGASGTSNGANDLPSCLAPSTFPVPPSAKANSKRQNDLTPAADPETMAPQAEVRAGRRKRRITQISVTEVKNPWKYFS